MEFYFAKINILPSLFATELPKEDFFFLGLKSGQSTQVHERQFMLADIQKIEVNQKIFFYGRLNKYGITDIEQMNVAEQKTDKVHVEQAIIGYSHFIIEIRENILAYSTNKQISNAQFLKQFEEIFNFGIQSIETSVEINPIKDNYSFYEKLQQLSEIKEISLAIIPTNPDADDIIRDIDEKLKKQNVRQKTILYLSKPGGIQLDEEIKKNSVYTDKGYGRGRALGKDKNGRSIKIYSKRTDKQRKSTSISIDDAGVYGLIEKLDKQIEQKKLGNEKD